MACGQPQQSNTTVQETRPSEIKADEPVKPEMLIVPGSGIGYIKINEAADSVIKALGKPTKQDAAMGAQSLTWLNDNDTITVYAHRNFGGKDENVSHIKLIRVTSPKYKTSKWVHVGFPLDSLMKEYPGAVKEIAQGIAMYSDVKKGITFEMNAEQRCSAIIVHAAGDTSAAYLDIRH
ncbi:hypothetical protein HQ865_01800 [Mucilaginibacter mali]|uniref:Uncharacterized protein n=1 Tax=Mucilaginibacter mali TaxID=2740462 RepID=A0A7D4UKL0_9SPHI|nr:hypothetical protein [Mucilaginibacter mali]QKJ28541.1 hypothetical protein HQ865_01800 [Mucilaginibacter mali]